MPHPYGFWSLLPPFLAIVLAVATRQVYLSLGTGVWLGYVIQQGELLTGTIVAIDACVQVFADAGNTRVILFSMLVGSLIALLQRSGGVDGFVNAVQAGRFVRGPRSAGLLAMAVGMSVFVESSISAMVTGTVARPIFDRLRMSREKLAYICDTCSAPTCMLIPLNGWGAFVLAQLSTLGVSDPLSVMVRSLPLNFYAIISLVLLLGSVASGRDFGPMRRAQTRARDQGKLFRDGAQPMMAEEILAMQPRPETPRRALNTLVPLVTMVAMVPLGIMYTGIHSLAGNETASFWNVLRASSGTTAVLWSVLSAVAVAGLLAIVQRIMSLREVVEVALKGAGGLLPLGLLMMLAFAIGRLCGDDGLATGTFVASLVGDGVPRPLIAPVLFIVASGIAFCTGTSWGTFAIMLAIAIPLAESLAMSPPLVVAAVLGGGVFGDHCSPISDTTVVSSMAAASDHIDHVRTQLPYALVAGLIALIGYTLAGLL